MRVTNTSCKARVKIENTRNGPHLGPYQHSTTRHTHQLRSAMISSYQKHGRNLRGHKVKTKRDYSGKDKPKTVRHLHDTEYYLDGKSRTKYGVETDSRRSNLYDAQSAIGVGKRFDNIKRVAKMVERIISTAWWQRRYDATEFVVQRYQCTRAACAEHWGFHRLRFPSHQYQERTVLHELIHATVSAPHAGHGRLYCARYLEIVGWWWNDDVKDRLREGYRENNVKWHPHNEKQTNKRYL